MSSSNSKTGISLGNICVYHKENGEWIYRVKDGEEQTLGTGKAINENTEFIISLQMVQEKMTFYVDHELVGSADIAGYVPGNFGIYNPCDETVAIKVDAIGAEELRSYRPSYEQAEAWKGVAGKPTATQSEGSIIATMPGVCAILDTDSPLLLDQTVEFDFSVNVEPGMSGGRYGFVLRGVDDKIFAKIEHDINGNWSFTGSNGGVKFPTTFALAKDKEYHIALVLSGNSISMTITPPDGTPIEMGTVSNASISQQKGYFGLTGWYGSKKITIKNVNILELETLPKFYHEATTVELEENGLKVTIDENFPRP